MMFETTANSTSPSISPALSPCYKVQVQLEPPKDLEVSIDIQNILTMLFLQLEKLMEIIC